MEYPEKLTMEYLIELAKERDERIKKGVVTEEDLKELKMSREEYEKGMQAYLNSSLENKVSDIIYDIAHKRITAVNKYDNYTLQRYEYPDNLETEVNNIEEEVGYDEYFSNRG